MKQKSEVGNEGKIVEKEQDKALIREKKFVNLVAKILVRKVIKKAHEKGIEIFKIQQ